MATRQFLLAAGLAASLLAMCEPAAAISSTFNDGLGGWATDNTGPLTIVVTGGNPSGYLKLDNDEGAIAHLFAPAKFLGNLSAYDGGKLSFDGNLLGRGGGFFNNADDYGHVLLSGPGGAASIDVLPDGATPPDGAWQRFSVPLTATAWGKTETEWTAILSSVGAITISVEALFGPEIQGFDNFRIEPPRAATPTMTWIGPWNALVEGTSDSIKAGFGLKATPETPVPAEALTADAFVAKIDVTADTRSGLTGGFGFVTATRSFTMSGCDPICTVDLKPLVGATDPAGSNVTGSFELGNPLFRPTMGAHLQYQLFDPLGSLGIDNVLLTLNGERLASEASGLGILTLNALRGTDVSRIASSSLRLLDGDYDLTVIAGAAAHMGATVESVADELRSFYLGKGGDPAFVEDFVGASYGYARADFFDTFALDIALGDPGGAAVPAPPTLLLLLGGGAFLLAVRRRR